MIIRFVNLCARAVRAMTLAFAQSAFATDVRLDLAVAIDVGASTIFSGSTTPSSRRLFVDALDIPAPLEDLMAESSHAAASSSSTRTPHC